MNKNETLLTQELYESIVQNTVREIVTLKQEQGETLNRISIEKETLKKLIEQLKLLKKDIKASKKTLRSEKSSLRNINESLNIKNTRIGELNNSFVTEEESYIDLNSFSNKETSKKR